MKPIFLNEQIQSMYPLIGTGLLVLILSGLTGCRQCRQVPCEQFESISLYVSGNIPTGTDTLKLYRYAKGMGFINPVDSTILLPSPHDQLLYQYIDLQFDLPATPESESDFEIVNPVDGRALRISDIQRTYLSHEVCNGLFGAKVKYPACTNLLTTFSYTVNTGAVSTNGNTLYLLY